MQLDRLAFHRLVPHGHDVERIVDQPLVGEVVPAVHTQASTDSRRAGAPQVFGLRRARLHERRHQHQVGRVLGDERIDRRLSRYRAVAPPEHGGENGVTRGRVHERPFERGDDEVRRRAFGASAQLRRTRVLGTEIPQVVDAAPQLAAEIRPRAERE
jgi:hypothetical protein